uniref:Uncharacterized protein n=1 Tax=Branchiostoma floridae TaxID=7739 RepID=C3YB63_BRAFL|eukprot:XP_002606515.1 hypothetical protein BRAFLDRAFT_91901 [Branchiostoma floridae]
MYMKEILVDTANNKGEGAREQESQRGSWFEPSSGCRKQVGTEKLEIGLAKEHVDLPDVPDLYDVLGLMMALDDIEVEVEDDDELEEGVEDIDNDRVNEMIAFMEQMPADEDPSRRVCQEDLGK